MRRLDLFANGAALGPLPQGVPSCTVTTFGMGSPCDELTLG